MIEIDPVLALAAAVFFMALVTLPKVVGFRTPESSTPDTDTDTDTDTDDLGPVPDGPDYDTPADRVMDLAHAKLEHQKRQLLECLAMVEDWSNIMSKPEVSPQDEARADGITDRINTLLEDVRKDPCDPVPDALLCTAHAVKHGPEEVLGAITMAALNIQAQRSNPSVTVVKL